MRVKALPTLFVYLWLVVTFSAQQKDPFSRFPPEQREELAKRLESYVQVNRNRDWHKLYDLISDTGKGSATRGT